MFIKQLSIFLENRAGRLDEALKILKENGVNIISLSLADTSDFGLLRLLVSDPDAARTVLKENRFSAQLGDILAIQIPHSPGSLSGVLGAITEAGINIEYMYTLSVDAKGASLALKTSDLSATKAIFDAKEIHCYTQDELKG